jgi:hypothetical protein
VLGEVKTQDGGGNGKLSLNGVISRLKRISMPSSKRLTSEWLRIQKVRRSRKCGTRRKVSRKSEAANELDSILIPLKQRHCSASFKQSMDAFCFYLYILNILLIRNGRAEMFSDYGSEIINRKHGVMFNSFYYSLIA